MDELNQILAEAFKDQVFVLYFTLYLVFFVVIIAAYWRIFQKLGRKGWECLIPIYNSAVMFKEIWNVKWFWVQLLSMMAIITSYFSIFLRLLAQNFPGLPFQGMRIGVMLVIFTFSYIVLIAINAKFSYELSKKFGQDKLFAVGLFFVPTIFYLILGFGNFNCVSKKACLPDEIISEE